MTRTWRTLHALCSLSPSCLTCCCAITQNRTHGSLHSHCNPCARHSARGRADLPCRLHRGAYGSSRRGHGAGCARDNPAAFRRAFLQNSEPAGTQSLLPACSMGSITTTAEGRPMQGRPETKRTAGQSGSGQLTLLWRHAASSPHRLPPPPLAESWHSSGFCDPRRHPHCQLVVRRAVRGTDAETASQTETGALRKRLHPETEGRIARTTSSSRRAGSDTKKEGRCYLLQAAFWTRRRLQRPALDLACIRRSSLQPPPAHPGEIGALFRFQVLHLTRVLRFKVGIANSCTTNATELFDPHPRMMPKGMGTAKCYANQSPRCRSAACHQALAAEHALCASTRACAGWRADDLARSISYAPSARQERSRGCSRTSRSRRH